MVEIAIRDAPNPTAFRMQEAYRWVRQVVVDLSEDQLRWQPNATTPSIRFHLFHIARWADNLTQLLTGADQEVWHAEGIAIRWGFALGTLGFGESGAMVDDEVAQALPLPGRAELFAYCDRVIAVADAALAAVDEDRIHQMMPAGDGQLVSLADAIADQLSHTARHLGMIECLRGIQGLRGTATV